MRHLAAAYQRLDLLEEREALEGSLTEFVKHSWSSIDSSEYQESWALDALCEHLEAVTRGHIKRLLVNFPPRCGKSNVCSIAWPAWVWAQSERSFLSGPNVRFLCGSYNHTLSLQHSNSGRRLLSSPFYQHYWGDRFNLMSDQNAKSQFDTSEGGRRIATSVGGSLIGIGGDSVLIDDPHNTEQVESEAEREKVLRWWREISSTRLNDPKQSAIVVVMQRLHTADVSGTILSGDAKEWTHLCLPMRHDLGRHCVTVIKRDEKGKTLKLWEDPRTEDGELMWPDRYGEPEVKSLEVSLGPYMASGRLQQIPTPAGGGIFKDAWWEPYDLPLGKPFSHAFDFRIASLDPAFTAKQENDPSGFTVWGVYRDKATGHAKVLLLGGWNKWLELHGKEVEKGPEEQQEAYIRRAKPEWGLVEWVSYECTRHNVNTLLVENKGSGHSVAQEIRRLYADKNWGVRLVDPKGQDKRARAYAVQHLFADGMIQAPAVVRPDGSFSFRDWAQVVIDEMSRFRGMPGEEDNIVDSATQSLEFLRKEHFAIRADEAKAMAESQAQHRPKGAPIYQV